jgi:hypothetical protein
LSAGFLRPFWASFWERQSRSPKSGAWNLSLHPNFTPSGDIIFTANYRVFLRGFLRRRSSNRQSFRRRINRQFICQGARRIFEQVWKTVNEKYYDSKFNGIDWNAVREKYRPQAAAASGAANVSAGCPG